ncbi:SusD/RagB family nutrient-binding outer membrane lipoprotein [Mucilaginibacter sp. OK283]|jgi:hypothetical protein|uniref:SusD/RagB family nutrient-binding outer membrane lipoprotein n=1 Tax=Mucilaginibacter sp. OK283 TaxID=1881049 RepID=UPI0008CDCE3C|nr:SusD/RagB family nutrient-binding outer membrane lipoprotein [Mucilaginibacter sp. OK283]SEO09899.1 Starch-binding associating with outer membrane [Mucilaginibacter sp. OK283]
MKTKTIFKRKVSLGLFFTAVLLTGIVGCQKGTFNVNDVNPNSPTSAPAKYSLSSSLAATANLVQGGNADVLENWMGYWTQSGGFTPSTTYVIYQITSSNFTGNFDNAYLNLSNYNLLLKTVGNDPVQANYRAIAMIMESYVYQRLVDLYNGVPYSQALIVNSTFSYKYDDAQTIYKSITAKCDSAIAIINANADKATSPGNYDVVFGGDMAKWTMFANTLKLKLLMRQTEGGIGGSAVKSALAINPNVPANQADKTYKASDFLSIDAAVNPGYSNASDAQENPFYFDVVATATGANGANTVYWRANSYGVNFFRNNNDPRGNYVYCPQGVEAVKYAAPINDLSKIKGRDYGSVNGNGESNTVISAILGTGFTSAGVQKGPGQAAVLLPASESLFLQAEAIERGYLAGSAATMYKSAVAASFTFLGAPGAADYTSQNNASTNYAVATDKIKLIITQKWAAMNSVDPLESYSDWRRLGIPTDLPVSKYPGVTVTHIPYRLPYPINETTLNSANVPAGGGGNDLFTSKIFWMK